MRAFIKDIKTFETLSHNAVFGYELKRSIYDTVSTIVIQSPVKPLKEGDIVFLDGAKFYGVIDTISLDGSSVQLGVKQINELFSRDMFFTAKPFSYLEDRLKELIDINFTNCADTFYRLPYLNVKALTRTSSQLLPDLDKDVFSVKSYAAKARRLYNIFFEWKLTRTALNLNIVKRDEKYRNIDFSNPTYSITEQAFSKNSVSKLTTKCEENAQIKDWVLLDNGSIVNTTPDVGRVSGNWQTLTVPKADEVFDAVKNEFLKNEYSHKITFEVFSKEGFNLYDRLKIRLDGKLFSSYVSGVTEKMNYDVCEIQCGELQTNYPYLKYE